MHINVFALAGISVTVVCFLLAFFILINAKAKLHRLWAFFNIVVGIFGLGTFFVGISNTYGEAFWAWKLTLFGVSLIALFFYHVVYEFCRLSNKKFLTFVYVHGILFATVTLLTNLTFDSLRMSFGQFYYYQARMGFTLFFLVWIIIVIKAFASLFFYIRQAKGIKFTQANYLFWGMLVGFAGGSTTSFPGWGFDIYPAWHFLICIYIGICTYAIFKYNLLDIRIVLTRLGIFVLVYSIVLGIPFGLEIWGKEWLIKTFESFGGWIPMLILLGFATAGPFIFIYVQQKAEERILRDQRRYQSTLKQASVGMMRIKDLKKLLNLIVYILARAVNLSHAFLFLYDPKSRDYTLEATRGETASEKNFSLNRRSALITYFDKIKVPIVFDEIKQQSQDYNSEELQKVRDDLEELKAAVAVPIFTARRLLAVGILGSKKSGAMFTADDLTVFSILANQVALAIENAQFFEESKHTQEQLFQAEKMATVGTMAEGLSHQINNRLNSLGFIAGDVLDTIKLKKDLHYPQEVQDLLQEIERALAKIQDNVRQGGEIVQGLLRYTHRGQEGFNEIIFDKLIDDVIEMTQFKIKKEYVSIVKDYPKDLPVFYGNFTQLQEVFFNIIDNAYDAIMQKRAEIPDEKFMGKIKISTRQNGKFLEVDVLDNGMGVKEEDQDKLFTPFFTTKATSKKGTGLGLYVIKKIVEDNHRGELLITSDYKVGTLFVVKLPMGKKEENVKSA